MQRVLGIDLGTTNSVVAYVRRGEPEIVTNRQMEESTCSVVATSRRGLLVGRAAKGRTAISAVASIKRFMGRRFAATDVQAVLKRVTYKVTESDDGDVEVWLDGRAYTPPEISSLILGRLKEEAEHRTGLVFNRAVITVPAYFGERQVAATRDAGRMAGFHVLKVLDEPTAAALAYGYIRETPDDDQTILVFDLGGGTFDISVLLLVGGVFTVLCVEGDNLMGGDDFDDLIAQRMYGAAQDEFGVDLAADPDVRKLVVAEAETAKIALSSEMETVIELPAIGEPPVSIYPALDRDEFVDLIGPRIDGAMKLVEKAVAGADLELADIDQVLLVGGSTAIPLVEERLAALFGRERIRKDVHPMKSVALGAAIMGQLVPEIECVQCHDRSPVAADDCTSCGRSLTPPPVVACPTCFRYAEVGTSRCGKCGSDFAGEQQTPAGTAVPPASATRGATTSACSTCGGALPSTVGAPCERCADPGGGGLRCLNCDTINAAGSIECTDCGLGIVTVEITAQDLGIELHDGSMAVVLPKNTLFPTTEPIGKEFATAAENQRRLEIVVYEGGEPQAQRNELCGYVTLALPPGLPRNSPIDVSFGLDEGRMVTVLVNVRAADGVSRRAEIQHNGRLDPESQQRLEAHRLKVTKFVDRWTDELSAAESAVFFAIMEEMELMLIGIGGSRAGVDEITTRADRLVDRVSTIRGQAAFISNLQGTVGKYLSQSDRESLRQLSEEMKAARDRADWDEASVVVRKSTAIEDGLSRDVTSLHWVRSWANMGKLSPALTHRANGALREYDAAFDRGDAAAVGTAGAAIRSLQSEAWEEVKLRSNDVDAVSKPQLAGG